MAIREDLTLGLDLGIGSCGWAVIGDSTIIALGSWTFDVPETDKERTPTNQLRRQHRGLRTVLNRRRQRMNALRELFHDAGLIPGDDKNALKVPGLDPWRLRADGLDRRLSGAELAIALAHIARHRGFKSNSKRDRGANAPKDSSRMLNAIEATRDRLAAYRTIGEMFARDPAYAVRKRNRDGDYSRSLLRDDQEYEARQLFAAQQRLGNPVATEALRDRFIDIAFFQRPLANSESKVGFCPFEPSERRAAKHSYSFELFRFLSRLAALRVRNGRHLRPLTAEEIAAASADFGLQKGMTFKRLRKQIGLADGDRFDAVSPEEEGKRDVVARSGDMAPGTFALRKVLGAAWFTLLDRPDRLDQLASVLTFREDTDSIRTGLDEIGLPPLMLDALMQAVENGNFSTFKGAGHISARACRAIVPHLKLGLVYSDACAAAGYDHARRPRTTLDGIANPIARKALTEGLKQVRAIVRAYGIPGRIHVELARDVGKSKDERDEIARGIEKRNKEKDRLRGEFAEIVGREPEGADDLLRFELWKEQNGRCLYTDSYIDPRHIVAADNLVQVDHILPWSRSGDDSYHNKTLCLTGANQEKKGRTPHEWLGEDEATWDAFVRRVESNVILKRHKKRKYLLQDASILEEGFRSRNLNDTRFASRFLADMLKEEWYSGDERLRVFARPGALTDRLRRGWGLQDLKKDENGQRIADDRHHALDALVVAATSQGALQRLTKAFQEAEAQGNRRDFSRLDPPWPGFVEEARQALREVFVARAERRRARGEAHAATIRQITERDGKIEVYERRQVETLGLKDLERIKDPDRNARTIASLRDWIEAGKPTDAPPLSPKGDAITKVRLRTNKKVDVPVRDGAADRGEMARVDVFRKANKKGVWEYYLVPIYPHQVADARAWPTPPKHAVAAFKDEDEWFEMTEDYEFLWSLHPFSFIEIEKPDSTFIDGYFRKMHRGTSAISVSAHNSRAAVIEGIGPRRLTLFKKYAVDRLGNRYEIAREKRTWRGAVCT